MPYNCAKFQLKWSKILRVSNFSSMRKDEEKYESLLTYILETVHTIFFCSLP